MVVEESAALSCDWAYETLLDADPSTVKLVGTEGLAPSSFG